MTKQLNTGEPVAWMQTFTQEYWGVRVIKNEVNIERIGINDSALYSQDYVNQLLGEIEELKKQLVTTSSEATLNYNKGHEDGRKLAIPSPVKELTDEDIRNIWASENGLEDMNMCKFDDFLQTFRFVEQAIIRKAQQ